MGAGAILDRTSAVALRAAGFRPVRLKEEARYLKRFGLAPDVVIDVGVYGGTRYLYRSFPGAKFVLIDPLAESRDMVAASGQAEGHDFHLVALGAEEGERVLSVTRTGAGKGGDLSSFHDRVDRTRVWIAGTEERLVPVTTLDRIAAKYPGRLGLKIDTEGHELDILEGASETLRRCDFVILEVSVTRRFSNAVLPSAIVARLAEAGLELRDVLKMAPPDHDMPRHMDMLFTRWPESPPDTAPAT